MLKDFLGNIIKLTNYDTFPFDFLFYKYSSNSLNFYYFY